MIRLSKLAVPIQVEFGRWIPRNTTGALRLVASNIADTDLARGRRALPDEYEAMGFFYPELSQSSRDPYAESTSVILTD